MRRLYEVCHQHVNYRIQKKRFQSIMKHELTFFYEATSLVIIYTTVGGKIFFVIKGEKKMGHPLIVRLPFFFSLQGVPTTSG